MHIISVANKKGGAGKTTTAVNLARALTRLGRRVLVVDLDSQANATFVLQEPDVDLAEAPTFARLLLNPRAALPVVVTPDPSIDLVPGGDELLELADTARPAAVAAALARFTCSRRYGVVLVDTEPRLGATTLSAIHVSNLTLIPAVPELFSISGLNATLDAVDELVAAGSRTQARIVLSNVDRSVEHAARAADLREEHGTTVVGTVPAWVSIRTATTAIPGAREPVLGHGLAVRAVYDELATAVVSESDNFGSGQMETADA